MEKRLTFDEIQTYLIRDPHVRSEITRAFGGNAQRILESLCKDVDPEIIEADTRAFLIDLLHNDARLYSRFTARGSYGNYHIDIKGLGGVYFYFAPEFGATGYFLSIDEATDAINDNWSDSLTSSFGRIYRKPFFDELMEPKLSPEKSAQTAPAQSRQKSSSAQRVLDFYLDEVSGQVFWHSKYGSDQATDISSLISEAFKRSESEVELALSQAQKMNWPQACRALKAACDAKKKIAHLEREIEELRKHRSLEIEVDDWLRNRCISLPTADDFKLMAIELKPFFHYREEAAYWHQTMPSEYLEAYRRLYSVRAKNHAERPQRDEE